MIVTEPGGRGHAVGALADVETGVVAQQVGEAGGERAGMCWATIIGAPSRCGAGEEARQHLRAAGRAGDDHQVDPGRAVTWPAAPAWRRPVQDERMVGRGMVGLAG